jgi:hypothetical protein
MVLETGFLGASILGPKTQFTQCNENSEKIRDAQSANARFTGYPNRLDSGKAAIVAPLSFRPDRMASAHPTHPNPNEPKNGSFPTASSRSDGTEGGNWRVILATP